MPYSLARCDTAIVSPIPGTTRDVVTGKIDLGGMPLVLLDTAGIHDAYSDLIEKEGIRRSLALGEKADVRVLVLDGPLLNTTQQLPHELLPLFSSAGHNSSVSVLVVNKCENLSREQIQRIHTLLAKQACGHTLCVTLSCLTGEGVEEFVRNLTTILRARYTSKSIHLNQAIVRFESPREEPAAITQARHRHHLQETNRHLEIFNGNVLPTAILTSQEIMAGGHYADLVLAAEHLRISATALGRITGHIDVEEVLDALFREFCIGK